MDIFTLVKANIRRKKGAFAGIMLFMLIISLSVTSIVSLKRNFENSIASEYDHMNGGNITLNIRRDLLTDDIIDEVNSHPFVRDSIVALAGIVIGTALSLSLSEKLLSYMLRSMGIANFVIDYRFATVFMPIAATALGFFVFAYITAARIKKVEIRTLITE